MSDLTDQRIGELLRALPPAPEHVVALLDELPAVLGEPLPADSDPTAGDPDPADPMSGSGFHADGPDDLPGWDDLDAEDGHHD